MKLSSVTDWVRSKLQRDGRTDLQRNMEKALRMKQEAGPEAIIPEHRTAHEGMRKDPSMLDFDRSSGREAGFTPQLKRSKVARSGDNG